MYRTIRFFDRITDYALFLFFLGLMLIGAYTMYDTLLIYNAARGADLRSFRPVVNEAGAYVWDMSALSEDVVAWLTVDDTNIDYPVLQGIDNYEYLTKDPFGKYSLSGSIFLDFRNAPDFTDPYSLIYGHHMEYGQMFGALDEFLDEEYFDSHRTGKLVVGYRVHPLEFFASVEADASTKEIFAPTQVEAEETLEYVRENATVWREPTGERLIALSTCKFPQTSERIIVFGVIKDEEKVPEGSGTPAVNRIASIGGSGGYGAAIGADSV